MGVAPRIQYTMLTPGSSGSLRLFELFGIPVRVHFTFLFLVLWLALFTGTQAAPAALALLVFALVVASVILHELGHALAARAFGIGTREIVLYPIGGVARLDAFPKGKAELVIAAAGPAVNLALALVLTLWMEVAGLPWDFSNGLSSALPWITVANIGLCVINLLPAFPMDGGRILRAFLTLFVAEAQATRVAATIGQGLAIVLALVALFGPGRNLVLLLIAFFVFFGAGQEAAFNRTRSLVRGRTACEAMMSKIDTLAPQDSLEWATRLFLATPQRDFPVIDAWGRVAGLLDRAALLRGLAMFGRDGAVLEAMNREPPTVSTAAPLEEVLRLLAASRSAVVVVDEERLEGVITSEKLMQLLEVLPRL